ncbi:MAG: hypothetical protein R3D67_18230 [Hyphomicrobiaceae bacterium]
MQGHEPAPHQSAAEAAPRDMFTASQIRMLKFAVIGMGAILLAGFALVIGRIVYLVNQPQPQSEAGRVSPLATTTPAPPGAIAPANLPLPPNAQVRHLALSASHLAVYFEAPGGSGLRLLHLPTGVWSPVIPVVADKVGKSGQ